MRDDLQFAALHSDDALLDALGTRTPGASLGVATGVDATASSDVAARLLGAWTQEIDTRPGPLADLLGAGAAGSGARSERSPLTAIETDAPSAIPLHARPRRRTAMPRAVAAATAGVLVLGLGGVAAASGGAPFESLRRAVGAAPEVAEVKSPAQRATALIAAAEQALDAGDLTLAAEQLAQAQNLLPQVLDARAARTLRAKMAAFQARWQKIVAPVVGALPKAQKSNKPAGALPTLVDPQRPGAPAPAQSSVGELGEPPDGQLVPEAGVDDPSDRIQLPDPGLEPAEGGRLNDAKDDLNNAKSNKLGTTKDGLNTAKDGLKDRAKGKLEPRPQGEAPKEPMPGDLPGPANGPLGGLGALGR